MPLASIPSPSQGVWHLSVLVPLRAYALCIVLGVIVAVVIGERRWRARGGEPGTIVDLAVWAVPFGLVGGRLYHVITDWQLYFGPNAPNEPIEALYVWNGGLGIWGAVALGAAGSVARLPQPGALPGRGGRHHRPRHRDRPGHRPMGQLLQPGAVRQPHRPAVGPGDRPRQAGHGAGRGHLPPHVPVRVDLGPGAGPCPDLGRAQVRACATAGCSRSTSRATPWAGSGSRACASTPPTTSWACGSTSGPRSSCSSAR